MTRAFHAVTALAIVAVPVWGWFTGAWSGGTTLLVYWFENVAGSALIVARMLIHRRLAPRRGHFRYRGPSSGRSTGARRESFVAGYATTSFAFTAVHGVFLGAILLLLDANGKGDLAAVDWRSVGAGCLIVFTFLALDFVVDLTSLRQWSFWKLEQTANYGLGRIIVVQFTLIFGFFGIAITSAPTALFGTFVVLKTLFALSTVLPQYQPKAAPKWLSRLMNRVPVRGPQVRPGETFEEFWAKDQADEVARRAANDEPWTAARR